MDNESGLKAVFELLESNRQFPKYALERRLDIFLLPYLPEFLSRNGGIVTFVAPEFPLKAESTRLSTNADYLMLRSVYKPAWLLEEVKTDRSSLDFKVQLPRYVKAQRDGMGRIIGDLTEIREASKHKAKYDTLLGEFNRQGGADLPIEIVYLGPGERPRQLPSDVQWFSLSEFAAWNPREEDSLWPRVQTLLRRL